MPACVNDPRVDQIARCTDELGRLHEYFKTHDDTNLGGAILGEMDWLTELHRLIWEAE
jgi:hypothetical protein